MSASRAVTLFSIGLIFTAAVGCSEPDRHGVSSGGPSWTLSAENPVPGIDSGTATITTLRCGQPPGVTVVIWSDLANGSTSSANATKERATEKGSHTGGQGRKVDYTLETTDGVTATITLEGAQFSTAAGNLFLVSTQSEKPRIAQINITIDDFPNEPEEIKAFAVDHEDIEKFFKAALPASEAVEND